MNRVAEEYRANAAAEIAQAEATALPNVRARSLAAAQAWTRMAERAEMAVAGRADRSGR